MVGPVDQAKYLVPVLSVVAVVSLMIGKVIIQLALYASGVVSVNVNQKAARRARARTAARRRMAHDLYALMGGKRLEDLVIRSETRTTESTEA